MAASDWTVDDFLLVDCQLRVILKRVIQGVDKTALGGQASQSAPALPREVAEPTSAFGSKPNGAERPTLARFDCHPVSDKLKTFLR